MPDDAPGREPRPLYSLEAEEAVIGGLMLSSAAYDTIAGVLSLDDFAIDKHRFIFRAVKALIDSKHTPDVLTVAEHLKASGDLEGAGGLAHLHQLAVGVPSIANIKRYADIVRDRALVRRVIVTLNTVGELAREANGLTGREIVDQVQRAFSEIPMQGIAARGELRSMKHFVMSALE